MPKPRYPMQPYPTSWYRIASSSDVVEGALHRVHYFGRDLIIFRDEEGTAHVADAHCPHMGAHVGYGGVVDGDCIRCPFHAWAFATDGHCVDVPYDGGRRPPRVEIR